MKLCKTLPTVRHVVTGIAFNLGNIFLLIEPDFCTVLISSRLKWFCFLFFRRSASLNEKEVTAPPPAGRRKLSLFRSMSESHDEPVPVTPVTSPASKPRPG